LSVASYPAPRLPPCGLLRRSFAVCGLNAVTGAHVMGFDLGGVKVIDGDDLFPQRLDLPQKLGLRFANDVLADGISDPVDAMEAAHLACPNGPFDLLFRLFCSDGFLQGHLEQAGWIVRVTRNVDVSRQTVANGPRLDRELHRLPRETIRCRPETAPERKHEQPHENARPGGGEIVDGTRQRILDPVRTVSRDKIDDGLVHLGAAIVLEALQGAGEEIKLRKRIRETACDLLLRLEAAAQQRHAQIGHNSEVVARAPELSIPALDAECFRWRSTEQPASEVVKQSPERIGDAERHVVEENGLEELKAPFGIGVLDRLQLAIEIRMRPQRALGEGDERPRENVG